MVARLVVVVVALLNVVGGSRPCCVVVVGLLSALVGIVVVAMVLVVVAASVPACRGCMVAKFLGSFSGAKVPEADSSGAKMLDGVGVCWLCLKLIVVVVVVGVVSFGCAGAAVGTGNKPGC